MHQTCRNIPNLHASIERELTDNGSTFRSAAYAIAGKNLEIAPQCHRTYPPQTNSKAKCFIEFALRERAYGGGHENTKRHRET